MYTCIKNKKDQVIEHSSPSTLNKKEKRLELTRCAYFCIKKVKSLNITVNQL